MIPALAAAAAFGSLAVAGIIERRIIERDLVSVPHRILVNGTRGKSTVTRLIAAGLRAGGIRTIAKTTGSAARLILPDGSEQPIRRKGQATIMEHAWLAHMAHKAHAEAMVAECMAISPETLSVLENALSQSTIGIITNVRLDHGDTMGQSLASIAECFSLAIPRNGRLLVAAYDEPIWLSIIRTQAIERGTTLEAVVPGPEIEGYCGRFSYPMFAENLTLALATCAACGVPHEIALQGMLDATPDPGVWPILKLSRSERQYRIINGFAANDEESTLALWRRAQGHFDLETDLQFDFKVLVYNHREDRPWRIDQMLSLGRLIGANLVCVVGAARRFVARRIAKVQPGFAVCIMENADLEYLFAQIESRAPDSARIGILLTGNIKGPGMALSRDFSAMAEKTAGATKGVQEEKHALKREHS